MAIYGRAAPVVTHRHDGFPITERRVGAFDLQMEQGIAVVTARSALIELGIPLAGSVVANRIGAPTCRAYGLVDEATWALVIRALLLGHQAAGHLAWLVNDAVDHNGNQCEAIECVDCERRSEALWAKEQADRP